MVLRVGGELALPGTREGGREWGQGKVAGLLFPSHLPAPTTRPASSGTLLPSTGGYIKKKDQRTEPEGEKERKGKRKEKGKGTGEIKGHYRVVAGSSEQVRSTQRQWKRKKGGQKD